MKVVLITNMPTPYRLPLWDSLRKLTDLEVICISSKEKNRKWNLENRPYIYFLKSYHLFFSKRDWALHISFPFSLFFMLIKQSPDEVIITGYDSVQYWEALLYAKFFGKKKILWNGSTLLSARSKSKLINAIKKYFIVQFDAYYTYGTEATKYIKYFGAESVKIITGINTVDTKYYKLNTSNGTKKPGVINFLYVGQLIERKGLYNTIIAFSLLKKNNWHFTILGSGVDAEALKKLVQEHNLNENVTFEGYKQKDEILNYYSNSDVLLMPSYLEVWGLVLNEALASGLFCLASKYAGATYDLIEDGVNGLIIDPKNIDEMVDSLEKTFDMEIDKQRIKENFKVSVENEADKLYLAIQ